MKPALPALLALPLALCLLGVAAPVLDTVVAKGESLEDVAARTLGSELAASELRALNGLGTRAPAAGARLKLPGPDRALALSAIASARNAVAQAQTDVAARPQAQAHLARAETLFSGAQYGKAAQEADAAWKLLGQNESAKTQFAVDVRDNGRTQVFVQKGDAVRVEAEGHTQTVAAGEVVVVDKGSPPGTPYRAGEDAALAPPEPLKPTGNARLTVQPDASGLGQARLSWKKVDGAVGYRVDVLPRNAGGTTLHLKTSSPEVSVALAPGPYEWRVQAVGAFGASALCAAQPFELVAAPLKLEVKGNSWK